MTDSVVATAMAASAVAAAMADPAVAADMTASDPAPGTPTTILLRHAEKQLAQFGDKIARLYPLLLEEQQGRLRVELELGQLQRRLVEHDATAVQRCQQQQLQIQQLQQQLETARAAEVEAKNVAAEESRQRRHAEVQLMAATRALTATRQAAHWERILEELRDYEFTPRSRSRSPRR